MNQATPNQPIIVGHDQIVSHKYIVHYPPHPPRENDPHYKDFDYYHRKYGPNARCAFAIHANLGGDPAPIRQTVTPYRLIGIGETRAECDLLSPLELHHSHIEFSLQNKIDLALLEKDYPGVSNPNEVGAWVESVANFVWYCIFHHRGPGGAHTAAASDFESEKYIQGLISSASSDS